MPQSPECNRALNMLCVGWSTGAVVTNLTRKLVETTCKSRFLNRELDQYKAFKNKRNEVDKTFHSSGVMGKCQSKNSDTLAKSNSGIMADSEDDEIYDRIVCQDNDIQEGQFKEIKLDSNGKVSGILIKQNGKLSALSNKCTHYGANLAAGSLGNGVIRCPWHGACFNVSSGDIEVRLFLTFE